MRGFGQITPGLVEFELTARGIYSETLIPVEPENGVVIFPDEPVDRLQPVVTFPAEDEVIRDLVPIPTPPAKKPFEIPGGTILIAGLIGLALIMMAGGKAPPARRERAGARPRVRTYTEIV